MFSEGFAGCVRERKGINENINNVTQINFKTDTKSMWKRCSKSDAKVMETQKVDQILQTYAKNTSKYQF